MNLSPTDSLETCMRFTVQKHFRIHDLIYQNHPRRCISLVPFHSRDYLGLASLPKVTQLVRGRTRIFFFFNSSFIHTHKIYTLKKKTIQWYLVHSHSCTTVTTIQFQNILITAEINPAPTSSHSPFFPSPGNH